MHGFVEYNTIEVSFSELGGRILLGRQMGRYARKLVGLPDNPVIVKITDVGNVGFIDDGFMSGFFEPELECWGKDFNKIVNLGGLNFRVKFMPIGLTYVPERIGVNCNE
jgi:hypothetical protein